ncbi:hypothetical protein LSAT2_011246 [Lamellibrachia satsuma]|nr:hypothetical protein LSAT2_011246 [Lamellibrachia satsuma]
MAAATEIVPNSKGPTPSTSTQMGESRVTSTYPSNPATPEQLVHQPQNGQMQNVQVQNDYTIASWLSSLGLSAYVDNFSQQGFCNMFELNDFTLEDLQKMKIGTHHRNKIWRSLVEFCNGKMLVNSTQSQLDLQKSGSTASTTSFTSAQNAGYCPEFYEVTRYTFKHIISSKGGDHSYC